MENIISSELKVTNKNLLTLNGVNKIISFNSNEFILETNHGPLHITGNSLELLNLDTTNGNIKIKGNICGYNYIDKNKKKEDSIIAKLFR